VKSRVDLLSNATAREQRITDLEQVLKQVREAAAAEKKKLEDELAVEKCKATEATAQFNALSIGRSSCRIDGLVVRVVFWRANLCRLIGFRNREEELDTALKNTKDKVRSLEVRLRESEAGGEELKRAMKEAADSEYVVSQKLAYETGARPGLEVEFEAVLKSLQNNQVTIAGYEVELNDLKGAASYAMDCIVVPTEGGEAKSIVDRLIDTPNRLLTLLKATSLAAATNALVRVKSHYPDIDMAKVKAGPDAEKDLAALELEVQDAATEVMDNLDYEGDDGQA
jgi:hypothetical protein